MNNSNIFSFIVYKCNEQSKLISSCDDGHIRIWDFHSGKLLKKIKLSEQKLRNICFIYENTLLVGCVDKIIKFLELNKEEIILSLKGHTEKICTVKKIFIPKYGDCIFSHGFDDNIKLWRIIN